MNRRPSSRRAFGLADADPEDVVARLRAIGSTDPDVLYAAKEELSRPFARQRSVGAGLCVVGASVAAVRMALFGVPVALVGAWLWHKGRRNVAAIDIHHAASVASLSVESSESRARDSHSARRGRGSAADQP